MLFIAFFFSLLFSPCLVELLNDGATGNDNRKGACADLLEAMNHQEADYYVVVAGDTLLEDVALETVLEAFKGSAEACLTYGYPMSDPKVQCKSRGLLVLEGNKVIDFLEKPEVPPTEPCLASAPLYLFKKGIKTHLETFLREKQAAQAELASYDAPGFLMAYLVAQKEVELCCIEVPGRIDIGTLADYEEALEHFANKK
jgi:dTDP-glucose pyrophosphorylase